MLSTDFFISNRRRLSKLAGEDGIIVVQANGLLQRSADTTFAFRQDSNFYYLTGLNDPDIVLVIAGDLEFLILPKRTPAEIVFGGNHDHQEIAKTSGVDEVYVGHAGWNQLKQLGSRRKTIFTCLPSPQKIKGIDSFYTNPSRQSLIQKLKRTMVHEANILDLRPSLVTLRQIKQSEEIKTLQHAIDITKVGFQQAQELVGLNVNEYQIEAAFDHAFKAAGASHGYQPIIASGKNACTLHYTANGSKLAPKLPLLIDVGAEYLNYSADISRTYNITTDRQHDVYQAVKRVQDHAIRALRPGLDWREYAHDVQQIMGIELVRLGLIKNPDDAEAIQRYFPHSIGHSLGLDVHDPCEYKTIEAGMVITVEPGIYIANEDIGVRIEDDILITNNGGKNLSKQIPY